MQITKENQVVCVFVFISVKLQSFANHFIHLDQLEIKEIPGLKCYSQETEKKFLVRENIPNCRFLLFFLVYFTM